MINIPRFDPNDLREVITRNYTAQQAAVTLAARCPADIWQDLFTALADCPSLTAEIYWLRIALANARLDRANLAAAARASIGAHRDGESDPLAYLRDELRAQGLDLAGGER